MNSNEKIAIYPGSFDPLTFGHLDIIKRSVSFLDKLVVGVGVNGNKLSYLFNHDERLDLIKTCLNQELSEEELKKIEVYKYSGLLLDFAVKQKAKLIIRGLRAFSDFDFEFNLAGGNQILNPDIETIFLITSINKQFISSKLVKEINSLNGDISKFVPKCILEAIKKKNKSSCNNI